MSENILKTLADNPSLTEAVRACITKYFSVDKLTSDVADIELGQMVRARLVGLQAVNDAFLEIARHKSAPKQEAKDNPAY